MNAKKTASVVWICVAVFLIIGVFGAVFGHEEYLKKAENVIENYSVADTGAFRRRNDRLLSYLYADGTETVSASDFIRVSEGAEFFVLKVVGEDKKEIEGDKNNVNVQQNPHCYLFVRVVNYMSAISHDYVIELVNEKDYQSDIEKQPLFIQTEGAMIFEK